MSQDASVVQRRCGLLTRVAVLLVVLTLSLLTGVAITSADENEGVMLLDARCSKCHGVDKVIKKKKTPEAWEKTVSRMVQKGAELTDAEQALLIEYLSKTYPKE